MKTAALIGISRHRLTTDGEGVTTLVAFHGCPLRCKYCLNPQSFAQEGVWKQYDCEQLYEEVKIDELYFLATHGGVTFGGGEPALQSNFISEFRRLCGTGWKITIETSLNVPQENIERLLPMVDCYIVDIKDMNNDRYETYTGKSNTRVIENLRWLVIQGKAKQITVRVPHIPSYNTETDIENSIHQLKEIGLSDFDRFTYRT
ncbi:radical SAM protein [Bacteroides nordii]|uniref:radical SAM protein n=1 Tax=Bacteroides nordii TaxID=291645 RepID=UPI00189AAE14|nr:radical SAM protein [Bacteroides nordii]